ncbi:MAG: hypothetical protein ACR2NZ_25230 [Rubripirellula sp.]
MNQSKLETKITVACPSGHRLRGDATLEGKTVKCPKCASDFVFASAGQRKSASEAAVTDTGVMRILGDMGSLPPAPERVGASTRPCTRCGVAISESLAVCNHCNCYIGVMPTFLKQMNSPQSQRN